MRCHCVICSHGTRSHNDWPTTAPTCSFTGHSQARGRETEPIASAGSVGGAGEGGGQRIVDKGRGRCDDQEGGESRPSKGSKENAQTKKTKEEKKEKIKE